MPRRRRKRKSTTINTPSSNVNPCAVFWDIENVSVQAGQSAVEFIKLIRDRVVQARKLCEIEFYCVSGVGKLTPSIENQIKSSKVQVIHVGHQRNAADLKIIELIKQFVRICTTHSHGCNIVLISGDSDFVKTLIRCKIRYKVKIYLIHCTFHRNDFLDATADEVFTINNGQLRQVTKSSDVAVIKVKPSSEVFYSSTIQEDLQSMFEHQGAVKESIYFDEHDQEDVCIWIGFPSKELAKEVARDKHNQPYHNHPLDVKYVQYPPAAVIKRLIKRDARKSVREETMNLLRVLTPNSFESSRSLSITSTLSLPFKSASFAYLIVTGFPPTFNDYERRQYLSLLFGKSLEAFNSTHDHKVWLIVHYPYQVKFYVDKISTFNCDGYKLSAIVSKELPSQKTIPKPAQMTVRNPLPRPVTVIQPAPRQVTVPRPRLVIPPTPLHVNNTRPLPRLVSYPDLRQVIVTRPSPRPATYPDQIQILMNRPLPPPPVKETSSSSCCSYKWRFFLGFLLIDILIIIIWYKTK